MASRWSLRSALRNWWSFRGVRLLGSEVAALVSSNLTRHPSRSTCLAERHEHSHIFDHSVAGCLILYRSADVTENLLIKAASSCTFRAGSEGGSKSVGCRHSSSSRLSRLRLERENDSRQARQRSPLR